MTTAQERQYSDLLALSGRSGGAFNELMIAASQRVTGFAPGTYDEAYISLLQSLTGDTTPAVVSEDFHANLKILDPDALLGFPFGIESVNPVNPQREFA